MTRDTFSCWNRSVDPMCINVTICVPKYAQIILHTRLCYVFPNSSWTFHTFKNIFTIYSSWLIKMTKNEFLKSIRETQIKIKDYPPLSLSKLSSVAITDKQKNKHLIVTHLFRKYQFTKNNLINIWYCLSDTYCRFLSHCSPL